MLTTRNHDTLVWSDIRGGGGGDDLPEWNNVCQVSEVLFRLGEKKKKKNKIRKKSSNLFSISSSHRELVTLQTIFNVRVANEFLNIFKTLLIF